MTHVLGTPMTDEESGFRNLIYFLREYYFQDASITVHSIYHEERVDNIEGRQDVHNIYVNLIKDLVEYSEPVTDQEAVWVERLHKALTLLFHPFPVRINVCTSTRSFLPEKIEG